MSDLAARVPSVRNWIAIELHEMSERHSMVSGFRRERGGCRPSSSCEVSAIVGAIFHRSGVKVRLPRVQSA